ncbi:MAG: MoxR family ATPase, partial [Verrucomicrobiota bacterium]
MSKFKTRFDPQQVLFEQTETAHAGKDVRDGHVYVYTSKTVLAIQVAMATGRPLLLHGPAGCGKSSLAAFAARTMNWNYIEQVITSRTRAQDIQWTFDALSQLKDARINKLKKIESYVQPQALWWAINPETAARRGWPVGQKKPSGFQAAKHPGELRSPKHPSVVLLDEIDKADPDVPNDMLVALGSLQFRVTESERDVKARQDLPLPLIIITTNNERSLPRAFLRRCVVHKIEPPQEDLLEDIAKAHFGDDSEDQVKLYQDVIKILRAYRAEEEKT